MSCVLCCLVCCVVVVLCGVWVHEGVVLCDELCVVLFGVLRGGGVVWCVGVLFLSFSFSLSVSLFLSILFFLFLALSLSFLFFPSSVLSSSFSSLFPSHQQTLCKAQINKRDVQL